MVTDAQTKPTVIVDNETVISQHSDLISTSVNTGA